MFSKNGPEVQVYVVLGTNACSTAAIFMPPNLSTLTFAITFEPLEIETPYLACILHQWLPSKWHLLQWPCDLGFDLCAINSFFLIVLPPGAYFFTNTCIFLSNDHSPCTPITSDAWFICMGPVELQGARWKRQITKWKNACPQGTRAYNLEISSLMLYHLSYPGFDEKCPFKVTFIHTCASYTVV